MFCWNDNDDDIQQQQQQPHANRLFAVAIAVSAFPLVAFLYAVVVWFSYSFYREIRWSHPSSLRSISVRGVLVLISWLVGTVGVRHACGVCRVAATSDTSTDSDAIPACLAGTTLVLAVLFAIASIRLALNTRRIHVVGVDVDNNGGRLPSFLGGGGQAQAPLEGKLVVVTGANNGIGKETARLLAARGATVAMLCRNPFRAKKAMQDIREHQSVLRNKNSSSNSSSNNSNAVRLIRKDQLVFVPIDLTDFGSIRQAAKAIQQHLQLRSEKSQKQEFVDALVCNAGAYRIVLHRIVLHRIVLYCA